MRILSLIIKQKYFDEILAGRQKEETRTVMPHNARKYAEFDDGGICVTEKEDNIIPKKYDALRLYVGYNKDRDSMLIEVTDVRSELALTPQGERVVEEDDNGEIFWVYFNVIYSLGRIIEKKVKEKAAK